MDGTTLHLENDEIILAHDRIRILDKVKRRKIISLVLGSLWLLCGVSNVWFSRNAVDPFEQSQLWFGVLIASLSIVDIVLALRQSTAREIPLHTIKQFRFRSSMMGDKTLVLELNNGLQRNIRVSASITHDLQAYLFEKGF